MCRFTEIRFAFPSHEAVEVGLTVIGYGGGGKDYFFLLIGISLCLSIRYGFDMYVPDRIGVGSIRRNGEEDGVPAVLQPLGAYFLPDGLPVLGKNRKVAADSRASLMLLLMP